MTSSPGDVPRRRSGELAWAAGLFEGEGTATICRGRARLALKMVERSSVERFAAAVGGTVYGPYSNEAAERADGHPRRSFWLWVAEGTAGAAAAAMLAPFLSAWRLERVDELFPPRFHVTDPAESCAA